MAHRVQPSVGSASSLFGSSSSEDQGGDFFGSLQAQEDNQQQQQPTSAQAAAPSLKVNPFEAIGEEVEINENEEHLFAAPQQQTEEEEAPAQQLSAPVAAPLSQPRSYAPNPAATSPNPYGQVFNPYGVQPNFQQQQPSAASQSPYLPAPSLTSPPPPASSASASASAIRPASALSRKQVDAYDPPMPAAKPLSRNKSSLALAGAYGHHQQQQQQRSTSPFTSLSAGLSATGMPYQQQQQPYSAPPPARPSSGGYNAHNLSRGASPVPASQYMPPPPPPPAAASPYAPSTMPRSNSMRPPSRPGSAASQHAVAPPPPRSYSSQSLSRGPSPAPRATPLQPPPVPKMPPPPPTNGYSAAPPQASYSYAYDPEDRRSSKEWFPDESYQTHMARSDSVSTNASAGGQSDDYGRHPSPPPMPRRESSQHEYATNSAAQRDLMRSTPSFDGTTKSQTEMMGWSPDLASQSSFKPLAPLGSPSATSPGFSFATQQNQQPMTAFPFDRTSSSASLNTLKRATSPLQHQEQVAEEDGDHTMVPSIEQNIVPQDDEPVGVAPLPPRSPYQPAAPPPAAAAVPTPPKSPYQPDVAASLAPSLSPPLPIHPPPAARSPSQPPPPPPAPARSPSLPLQPPPPHIPLTQTPPPPTQSPPVPSTIKAGGGAGVGVGAAAAASIFAAESSEASRYRPSSSTTGIADRTGAESPSAKRDPAIRSPYPVAAFGFGGKLLTSFPSSLATSFGGGSNGATVRIQDLSEAVPDSLLKSFPGPLFVTKTNPAKSKKEVLEWLQTRTRDAEREAGFNKSTGRAAEAQRASDLALLLQLLSLMVEFDGTSSGSPAVESRLKSLLNPEDNSSFTSVDQLQRLNHRETPVSTVETLPSQLQQIRTLLLSGQRSEAVEYAIEKRLWAHAMVLGSAVDTATWSAVVQQFASAELSNPEAAGLQLVYNAFVGKSTLSAPEGGRSLEQSPSSAASQGALDGWRDSVAMILANPSSGSSMALTNLGDSLASEERYLAAHVCYLLSPSTSPIGAVPGSRLMLLGQPSPSSKPSPPFDMESVLLTEVLEFAVSLTPTGKGQEPFTGFPHLHAYRLAHAYAAADTGNTQEAQKYCDSIGSALKATQKMSPYFHPALVSRTKDLLERATGASQRQGSGSWVTRKMPQRPTLDSLWNTLEGRFTSFVAGESEEQPASASSKRPESVAGPFAHYSAIGAEPTEPAKPTVPGPFSQAPTAPAVPPPGPPPPGPPAFSPRKAAEPIKKGHTHKRSQSMGFLAYGSDPYASAPSWAPPPEMMMPTPEDPASEHEQVEDQEPNQPPPAPAMFGAEPTPPPMSQPPSQPTISEEDDIEDLGFGNASSKASSERKRQATESAGSNTAAPASVAAPSALASPPAEKRPAPDPALKTSGSSSFLGRLFRREASTTPGPVQAKLGEETSFVYDPDLKRWVNKKAGAPAGAAPAAATPPPPRAQTASPSGGPHSGPPPRPVSSTGLRPGGPPPPSSGAASLRKSESSATSPKPPPASSSPALGDPPASLPSSNGQTPPPGSGPPPPRKGTGKKPARNKYIPVV